MPSEEATQYEWRKSSFSNGGTNGECVEIGFAPEKAGAGIRDSKLGDRSPILHLSHTAWTQFLEATATGRLDRP